MNKTHTLSPSPVSKSPMSYQSFQSSLKEVSAQTQDLLLQTFTHSAFKLKWRSTKAHKSKKQLMHRSIGRHDRMREPGFSQLLWKEGMVIYSIIYCFLLPGYRIIRTDLQRRGSREENELCPFSSSLIFLSNQIFFSAYFCNRNSGCHVLYLLPSICPW